jgi:hypothetical protein
MFKGDWIKYAALGLIAIAGTLIWAAFYVGSQLGEEFGNAEYSADYHEQYASEKIERECINEGLAGRELHDCIQHQVQTSYEHHTAYADLAAQSRMANWAMVVGVLSGITVFVTGAGVFYVALTLNAARTANETAHNAVVATEKIGEAQTRGYLTTDGGKLSIGKHICGAHVSLRNIGLTPVVSGKMRVHLTSFDDETLKRETSIVKVATFQSIAMGNSDEPWAYWDTSDIWGFITEVASNGYFLSIDGDVEWIDVFGKTQEAKFSLNVGLISEGIDSEDDTEIEADFHDWKNQNSD